MGPGTHRGLGDLQQNLGEGYPGGMEAPGRMSRGSRHGYKEATWFRGAVVGATRGSCWAPEPVRPLGGVGDPDWEVRNRVHASPVRSPWKASFWEKWFVSGTVLGSGKHLSPLRSPQGWMPHKWRGRVCQKVEGRAAS